MVLWLLSLILGILLLAALLYYLLVVTEGVYLGRRTVVWLYDITAYKYDGIKEFEPDFEAFFVIRPLLVRLQAQPAPLVLDVATGTGRLPYFLLEQPTFNGRVVGLDASCKMLQHAAGKLEPYGTRVILVQQLAGALPFADDSFDAITCLEALEFFPSAEAALREMIRVLKPGASLLTTRRKGAWGKAFVDRYRSVADFATFLEELGLEDVYTVPWQTDYDQVYGRKPTLSTSQTDA